MGSAGFFIAGIVILALVAAGVGFYLYQRKGNGDTAGLFAPRARRLAYVERTALEGGRKLILVRRDDVEHLILIGGPIDLVVESGIRSDAVASPSVKEASFAPVAFAPSVGPLADSLPDVEPVVEQEPHLPIFPKAKEAEKAPVFGPMPEVKAVG
jgi:flagellar protein FliO/FliZ